jgi:hypothetical protein
VFFIYSIECQFVQPTNSRRRRIRASKKNSPDKKIKTLP